MSEFSASAACSEETDSVIVEIRKTTQLSKGRFEVVCRPGIDDVSGGEFKYLIG